MTDDESVGLTLSTTALGVTEGDDAEYTVRLATQPTATVTVAVTGQASTDLSLDAVVPDVHDVDVEHGADGDGLGGAGRRRGERRGDASAHGFGGRLRGGDGRGCR